MDDIKTKTLNELVESGASIQINFHSCDSEQSAYSKIKPFGSLGEIEKWTSDKGFSWFEIDGQNTEVAAFFDESEELSNE